MRRGTVIGAVDHGTIWQLLYWGDNDSIGILNLDHRCFANFYDGVTGSNFYRDSEFGRGREYVADQLKGIRVAIESGPFRETVRVED